MFSDKTGLQNKDNFLKQTEDARLKRNLEKKKLTSAIKIQALFRGYLARKHFLASLEDELKQTFLNTDDSNKQVQNFTSTQIFEIIKKYLFISKKCLKKKDENKFDHSLFQNICTGLVNSILKGDFKHSYMGLIMSKESYQTFLKQSHRFLQTCLNQMNNLNIKDVNHYKTFISILNVLTTFTEYKLWKCYKIENNQLLERTLSESSKSYLKTLNNNSLFQYFNKILIQNSFNYHPVLKTNILINILNIIFNVMSSHNFESSVMLEFNSNVMTIPFLFKFLQDTASESNQEQNVINTVQKNQLKQRIIEANLILKIFNSLDKTEMYGFLKDKDINHLICFLGNFSSLSKLEFDCLRNNIESFVVISNQIIQYSYDTLYGKSKIPGPLRGADNIDTIRWHPLFGFLKLKTCFSNFESLIIVLDQLRFLWSHQFISILFDTKNTIFENINNTNFKDFIKGFFDKTINKKLNLLDAPEAASIYKICSFYRQLLLFLNEPRIEILSALSIEEEFLLGLWNFISSMGVLRDIRDLVKILELKKDFNHPIFDVLYLICSLVLYLVTVQDENEFYEVQPILKISDYKILCNFLNNFIYKIISNELIDLKTLDNNSFFSVFHQLLTTLYTKDSRRPFIVDAPEFWIIREIKFKSLISDLEKETLQSTLILQNIPHAIPLKNRIEILQNKIEKDKQLLYGGGDAPQVRINIRRNRMIEDAYTNLANLPPNLLKGTIRISFINDFGLREAGIDQDGVFKEFLVGVIKQLVDLKFNLFQVTSDQQLYPSPSSYFIEDHLQMFCFAGKLLGKLIYENQVVDVEFASFFLRQLAGYRYQNYSFLDDLATLDRDLYKNLNSIKHDNNVSDLELTFTHSEFHLGKLISHELVPSGFYIKVTNENKIKYIHLLAHFKLHKQIKDQVNAFNEGFKSIIKQEWLNMFSVSEIQLLISGSLNDINFEDLKKNVQYWGGLHSGHRLVKWLWEILENDFNREERSLFLKFVTSSPKPPLLGFSSLNPPFSIRCVESDEQDGTIYDSSLRGFFKTIMNIGVNDTSRLPTSSTCFNLLKLPNYSKKSTLRDKLRYAIKSNSGFELS